MSEYVTYQEFQELTGNRELPESDFNKYVKKANLLLDNLTVYFYQYHNIDDDIAFRANQFKKALCAQITYFSTIGVMTSEELNNSPQSVSIGRTTVNYGGSSNESQSSGKSIIANDVFTLLEGTGLLYRGVSSC